MKGLRDLDISSDTDESVEAIVGRVAALIALAVVGFAALFAAGCKSWNLVPFRSRGVLSLERARDDCDLIKKKIL